ncbi:MAG: CoA transferase [Gammaproteobacteria bacterium]|nr:CoA transferase [Gammaproteobacteria bacterium]MYK46690.1 CoA transferase [Gammaproteobacteria bacterium]
MTEPRVSAPLRVLELGGGVSAAYAAKLLGDHGADVVKVEPLAGDPTRRLGPFPNAGVDPEKSGTFLALNVNKRGVCLDVASREGRSELDRLLGWADILVHNEPRLRAVEIGIDPARLEADFPRLVTLSITPFGIAGPYRDYRATELIVANAGGWANFCPGTHPEPEFPPLKVFGHPCAMMAGTAGALVALATAREARCSGVGDTIDLSEQDYVASALEAGIPVYSYRGAVLKRFHERGLIPWGIFQAKDKPIFLVCVEQDQWERLVKFMGNPDWAALDVFADVGSRAENQDLVHQFVQDFIGDWNAWDLYHEAQKQRICFAPVTSYPELAANEHLRARGFFATVDQPGIGPVEHLASPVLTRTGRSAIRRHAPRLGEHNQEVLGHVSPRPPGTSTTANRPLHGVRVVDLTWVWAGTYCAMNLAHLGADVIHIESAKRPDLYRRTTTSVAGDPPDLNRSGMFNQWNQGKKGVAVDLRSAQGIEIVKDFVRVSDVVTQNFATGVMERLGLGYDVLREINPGIILASISGYGQSGPYRDYIGYGPAASALTGTSDTTGYVGGGPEEVGVSMPDPNAGITGALAIVSALERRDETGAGDHLDVTLFEASAAYGVEAWMQYALDGTQPERLGNRDPHMAPHGCFPCQGEDEWIAIACASDDEWQTFAALIDPTLADDERFESLAGRKTNEDALEEAVASWTRTLDRWQITALLQSAGIAAFPTFTCKDIVEDPHLNARGYIERLAHPETGSRAHAGIPWRLARRPNGVRFPAPCLGADTEDALRDILGYDEERINALRLADVLT